MSLYKKCLLHKEKLPAEDMWKYSDGFLNEKAGPKMQALSDFTTACAVIWLQEPGEKLPRLAKEVLKNPESVKIKPTSDKPNKTLSRMLEREQKEKLLSEAKNEFNWNDASFLELES